MLSNETLQHILRTERDELAKMLAFYVQQCMTLDRPTDSSEQRAAAASAALPVLAQAWPFHLRELRRLAPHICDEYGDLLTASSA